MAPELQRWAHMKKEIIEKELKELVEEFGDYPYEFFTILLKSDNPNIDFDSQNKNWEFVKDETWHSIDLSSYILWSISDNGDLLWWNGQQTILMDHRGSEFLSTPVNPHQFIRLVGLKKFVGILPDDLVK